MRLKTLQRLMLRDSRFGPHLRAVETAMRELRKKHPEPGLGEDRIRNLIARGKIPSLRVGNRSYIPMEAFYNTTKSETYPVLFLIMIFQDIF